MTSWTETSAAWIAEQAKQHPGMTKAELEKHCRKNYPFSQRMGWAYKAWLKAMRTYFRPQVVRPVRNGRTEMTAAELEQLGQGRLL